MHSYWGLLYYLLIYILKMRKKVVKFKRFKKIWGIFKNIYGKFKYDGEFSFSLAQKMNCFRIYEEINEIRKGDTKKENLELSLYILLLGITQNREDKNNIDLSI